ncbi:MAG: hypothetical protein AAFZ07_17670 [Actinomycetota bacterium]
MSIPVDLDALADTIAERGPVAFFLTGGPDGRPHATHATVELDGGVLRVGAGRKTARNATDRPAVSFLWPPAEEGGYSLIVDGDAVVEGDEGERVAVVTPSFAVLHRPADHTAPPADAADGACESDCKPIGG